MSKNGWRLLNLEYDDSHMNVALEEAIMTCVGSEVAPCTLRFWRNLRAVVIGSFQSSDLEVDLDACETENIPVIRRVSGGGAVYHDEGNLNYSLFLLKSHPLAFKGFQNVFNVVGSVVTEALRALGLDVEHPSQNTITVGDRKISGLAGAVKHGAILVHGSLLIHSNLSRLSNVLGLNRMRSPANDRRAFTRSQKMDVINLEEALDHEVSLNDVKGILLTAFEDLFSVKFLPRGLTESEERLLRTLYTAKYRLKKWNFKYSP
ncbi:MAG: lipoate--protein ligase family protein [Candidatus Bathyarchaeota archaeon]|nr:lipoate--protein ligase family protein [Candidatus Bathyarchaeota archaeon]